MRSKKILVIVGFLGLYLLSTGVSWAIFSYGGGGTGGGSKSADLTGLAKERAKIADQPKTEVCPLNGGKFTKTEKGIWEDRRPMTAIIENNVDARPYSGLSRADVVYEAVAESGVTRFLAVFYCGVAGVDLRVAVIRSARVHFVKWAAEYGMNPIFVHWGGANNIDNNMPNGRKAYGDVAAEVDAFALLDKLSWRNGRYGNDFDGQSNTGVPVLKREMNRLGADIQVAKEHTPVLYVDEGYLEAEKRGFGAKDEEGVAWDEDFESWSFKDEEPLVSPKASKISFIFWDNWKDYDVEWDYDGATNSYKRINGGEPFVDWEFDNKQVTAKNVVIQFVAERGPVDRELHMYYEVIDDGEALVFQNGDVIEGTWEKESLTGRTLFYDENGEKIEFVRGEIWIEAVPKGNDIVY